MDDMRIEDMLTEGARMYDVYRVYRIPHSVYSIHRVYA